MFFERFYYRDSWRFVNKKNAYLWGNRRECWSDYLILLLEWLDDNCYQQPCQQLNENNSQKNIILYKAPILLRKVR